LTKQLLSVAYISLSTKLQTSHHSEVSGLEMTKFGEKTHSNYRALQNRFR